MDADMEGFLRSETSLFQIVGRAAEMLMDEQSCMQIKLPIA